MSILRVVGCLNDVALTNRVDRWTWNLDPSGEFKVSLLRRWIDNCILPSVQMQTRWNRSLPRKVNI